MNEPKADPRENPGDKRILVVDDDPHICSMVQANLELEGFQIQIGRDGRDILKKAVGFKPDLIVMDLMMPGGGGYEAVRTLQSDDLTRKTPVILITGYTKDHTTQSMMMQESNVVAYLEKPLRVESLILKIHKVLKTVSRAEKMAEERQAQDPAMKKFEDLF